MICWQKPVIIRLLWECSNKCQMQTNVLFFVSFRWFSGEITYMRATVLVKSFHDKVFEYFNNCSSTIKYLITTGGESSFSFDLLQLFSFSQRLNFSLFTCEQSSWLRHWVWAIFSNMPGVDFSNKILHEWFRAFL